MRFSTIFTMLFCPNIAHEQTAHNLDYVSLLVACRSLLFFLLSAIAPKMKVGSRAKSDWAISKSDAPSTEIQ